MCCRTINSKRCGCTLKYCKYKFIADNVNFYLQYLEKQSFLVLNDTHLKHIYCFRSVKLKLKFQDNPFKSIRSRFSSTSWNLCNPRLSLRNFINLNEFEL